MSSREFWAAEAAKMRDTSALFDMSHLSPSTANSKDSAKRVADGLSDEEFNQVISQRGIKFLPYYVWEKNKIDYSSLRPCLRELFADLNRTTFSSGIGGMGEIIKQFTEGLNADAPAPSYKVKFEVVNKLPVSNLDLEVVGYTFKDPTLSSKEEKFGIRIFLKKDFISKASDAAIILVYLHEMLHALMIYQTEIRVIPNVEHIHDCLFENGKPTPQTEAQHSQMANKYVELLNDAMAKWAFSQKKTQPEIDKLKDIGWEGLSKTVEYAKKRKESPATIARIREQFNLETNNLSGSTGKIITKGCYNS